jgi:hypothetical protein
MDQSTLVNPQIEAGKWMIDEFAKHYPVKAAYWLRSDEDGDWYLYLASDKINDANFDIAYGEVLRITSMSRNSWLNPFRVKVVGMDDSVARAIAAFTKNYPGTTPMLISGGTVGNVWMDGAIVYPPPFGQNNAELGAT